ncbi:hypothetical protein [Luteibacter sp. E-22]|uniref:hypothetical protein n=1 Tax=Luteibacter sp. E-22 TaxID=3404050 RepID=UPI003CFA1A8C
MSTIAYRDGVMAADTRAYGGRGEPSPGRKRKIHKLDDGSVVGVSTATLGLSERFVAWLKGGGDPKDFDDKFDLRAVLVKPDGALYVADDTPYFSGPMETDFYAIGSGACYAMGAMAMGATAEEAVRVACEHDGHSALPIMVERL